jgi:hypothetical protein
MTAAKGAAPLTEPDLIVPMTEQEAALERSREILTRLADEVATQALLFDQEIADAIQEAVERTIEQCELAARRAKLPPNFQWGEEARDNFDFGKEQAARAIRALRESKESTRLVE